MLPQIDGPCLLLPLFPAPAVRPTMHACRRHRAGEPAAAPCSPGTQCLLPHLDPGANAGPPAVDCPDSSQACSASQASCSSLAVGCKCRSNVHRVSTTAV